MVAALPALWGMEQTGRAGAISSPHQRDAGQRGPWRAWTPSRESLGVIAITPSFLTKWNESSIPRRVGSKNAGRIPGSIIFWVLAQKSWTMRRQGLKPDNQESLAYTFKVPPGHKTEKQ